MDAKNTDGSKIKKPVGWGAKLLTVLLVAALVLVFCSYIFIVFINKILEAFNS